MGRCGCKNFLTNSLQNQKVVVDFTYEGWLFMRGPGYRDFSGKILVFWIGGCLWEAVAGVDLGGECRGCAPSP